jgi:thioredoxin 1
LGTILAKLQFSGVMLMSALKYIEEDTFQKEVLESTTPVLVDFTAVWCGPCKMLDPVVTELAEAWQGRVKVVKLDVDNNQKIAMDYRVMGVPTLILFKDGEIQERLTGYRPKKKLIKKLEPHF